MSKKRTNERTETHACDLISRQAAIDAVKCGALSAAMVYGRTEEGSTALCETVKAIKALPFAQPETEERTAELVQNVSDSDLISRKAAIDAVDKNRDTVFHNSVDYEGVLYDINNLPSAQPEPCEDAVSRNAIIQNLRGR